MNEVTKAQDSRPPIVVLRDKLASRQGELRAALTDISPENFIRAVMTSVALNPELLGCSWQSIWNSCLKACRDGLLPDGVDSALVPFKGQASYIPMYGGLLRRFRRSGQFKWITANIVRQGEPFEHWIDEHGEHFRHVPGTDINAPMVAVYAIATTRDNGIFIAVLPLAEADQIKAMSKATREDSPWKMWPSEMYKKTALRRLSKVLPSVRDISMEEPPEIEATAMMISDAATDLPRLTSGASEPKHAHVGGTPKTALDHFAGDSGEHIDRETGEIKTDPEPAVPPPAEQMRMPIDDSVNAAHSAGKDARAAGMQRRALPGEYRTPERQREAEAWLRGWDGLS